MSYRDDDSYANAEFQRLSDGGSDFIRFHLPAWLSGDEVVELQRLASIQLAGILAAHRVAAAERGKLASGTERPGGIDEAADVLGVEVDELRHLLGGGAPGFTVAQLARVGALVGCSVSELVAGVEVDSHGTNGARA